MVRSLAAIVLGVTALTTASSFLWSQSDADFKLTEAEKSILESTNAARKEKELPPVLANATLTKCARDHSANMLKQMKMAHELDGKTPFDRIKDVGYKYRRASENVAYGDGASIDDLFEGWMKSEGHRKNILDPDVIEIGIGVATSGRITYATQVFGKPLSAK